MRAIVLLMVLGITLSGCGAPDGGHPDVTITNTNTSNATNNNDSANGDTQCSTDYAVDPNTGACHFVQTCDGHAVSSGDFQVTPTSPCPSPTPAPVIAG